MVEVNALPIVNCCLLGHCLSMFNVTVLIAIKHTICVESLNVPIFRKCMGSHKIRIKGAHIFNIVK